jgi:hypothetical protein
MKTLLSIITLILYIPNLPFIAFVLIVDDELKVEFTEERFQTVYPPLMFYTVGIVSYLLLFLAL